MGTQEDLSDAHSIRRAVFIEEQGVSYEEEHDGTDGACIHLVLYDEKNTPVATGRIMVTNEDFVIGRVATLKSHRGQGLGTAVMQTLIDACVMMGAERQILGAQIQARDFYEKLGFVAYGDVYDDAGIPHISMERIGGNFCCRNPQAPF
jgi:ElaA protein